MSGHNKWSQIKRKKEITDGKKSQIFSKIVRLITTEAKKTNGDRNSPSLRMAIEKAKEANMPNDNIERAIKKATESGESMEPATYEAYGPGGAGIIIEALTANKNKASQEIKHILSKNGFALGGIGSVVWGFVRENGEWVPTMNTPISEEDKTVLEELIDELEENEEVQDVYTNAE